MLCIAITTGYTSAQSSPNSETTNIVSDTVEADSLVESTDSVLDENGQFPKFLTQPDWLDVIITLLAFIVGSGLTIYFFRRGEKVKKLGYEVITDSPLFDISDQIGQDITIQYKGQTVESLAIVIIEIKNSGNIPIKPEDFNKPLCINVGDSNKIFDSAIIDRNPEDIDAVVSVNGNGNAVEIEPLLLNEQDSILLKIVSDQDDSENINLSSRIVGVSSIDRVQRREVDLPFFARTLLEVASSLVTTSMPGAALTVEILETLSSSDSKNRR